VTSFQFEEVDLAVSRVLPSPGSSFPLLPRTPEISLCFPSEPMALDEKHDAKFEEVGAFESPGIHIQPAVRPEDPASVEERRLVRKLDRRILPIACFMYLFACQYHYIGLVSSQVGPQLIATRSDLDRTNLGNARLQGLAADILGGDPTGKRFDWVNSSFFFSYVCLHTPRRLRYNLILVHG